MRAGRPGNWLCLLLLAGVCGCEQLDALRQGAGSTYKHDLRELAREINRQETEKIAADDKEPAQDAQPRINASPYAVTTASHWHTATLVDAVQLKRPVPLDGGNWAPHD
jgi:hypothetical protein